MKVIRNLTIAIIVYALLFIGAGKFLETTRPHLPFALGSFIDALVSIGIVFNFIVLLLISTKLMTATRAVITSAIATGALVAVVLSLISMRVPADLRPGGMTILTLAISFLIWFGLHWMWAHKKTTAHPAA